MTVLGVVLCLAIAAAVIAAVDLAQFALALLFVAACMFIDLLRRRRNAEKGPES